jgi:acetylornithine deacetylase/succinyl-diaminopimelate desuccinylase-like protein
MRVMLALALLSACAPKAPAPFTAPPRVDAFRDRVDWEAAGDEATALLSGYLQLRTLSGQERPGAEYLAAHLAQDGITAELIEYAPGYVNLIARLPGSGAEPPLCLLSHIDVVDAVAADWPAETGPWSGAVSDGYVWGRGALDMKSLGALEALVLTWLARLDVPLRRDVILLAVADEEVDNTGARWLAANWDRIGCSHLINEGGIPVEDAFFPGQTIAFVSTGEKGVAWLDLVATGEPGHGSTPMPDQSPDRLRAALERLEQRRIRRRFPEPVFDLLDAVGRHQRGLTGAVLASPFLVNTVARGKLLAEPAVDAITHDTCNLTGFAGAGAHNVVAARSVARLDCRLLPETDPDAFVAALREQVAGEGVSIEVVSTGAGAYSPTEDPLYQAIAAYATEGRPDTVAGPVLSVGYTDSLLLRPLGVRAYGFAPLRVSQEEARTMHGNGERVRVDELQQGLRTLLGIVLHVAAE